MAQFFRESNLQKKNQKKFKICKLSNPFYILRDFILAIKLGHGGKDHIFIKTACTPANISHVEHLKFFINKN